MLVHSLWKSEQMSMSIFSKEILKMVEVGSFFLNMIDITPIFNQL